MPVIFAPFTKDQVESLNAYQISGIFHPFTCGSDKHKHQQDLIALTEGMYCPNCEYFQNWIHDWMADWTWKNCAGFFPSKIESVPKIEPLPEPTPEPERLFKNIYRGRVWCSVCGVERRILDGGSWPICCETAMLEGCKGQHD